MGLASRGVTAFVWAASLNLAFAQPPEGSQDAQYVPEPIWDSESESVEEPPAETAVVDAQVSDGQVPELTTEPASTPTPPRVVPPAELPAPSAEEAEESAEEAEESEEPVEPNTWERDSERLRLDLGLTYATFEQQVKSEVGGVSVEPLVEDRAFGLALTATYGVWKYIRLGLFFQLDVGSRFSSRYAGLDANGTPVINGRIGGSYREFWMGPLLRVQWKGIAAEFGYGAFGVRSDDARDDLPTAAGETGAFRTSPSVAWHAALSGYVPVHPHVDVVFRIQYRVRYYNRRSGDSLAAGVVHGTQNLTPTIGVSWRL